MSGDVGDQIDRTGAALAKPLFFIAGTERSGTTWLQLLMDAHPEIACRGEGHFVDHLFPNLDEALAVYRKRVTEFNQTYFKTTKGFPLLGPSHEIAIKRMIIGALLAEFDPTGKCRILGEKTPSNIRDIDKLDAVFPDARFVFIVRDCRDVAVSLWYHGRPEASARPPLAELARDLAHSWRRDVIQARTFATENPGRSILVRYEDLHRDAPATLGKVFYFLGADHNAGTIDACIAEADFSKFSGGRARGEEDSTSQFRKGVIGDWQNYREAGIDETFRKIAGDVMAELGYE